MDINFNVQDRQVKNLTEKAKKKISNEAQKYVKELITAAKSCERSQRGQGADCEVTDNHVLQAKQKLKFKKKRPLWWYIVNIFTQVAMLVMGLLFDIDQFVQDGKLNLLYLCIMIFLLIICIAGIFVSNIFGGE